MVLSPFVHVGLRLRGCAAFGGTGGREGKRVEHLSRSIEKLGGRIHTSVAILEDIGSCLIRKKEVEVVVTGRREVE